MAKRSDLKQEDIINSAIAVFSEKGLEQASMEGISKSAGVSKRTLYKYYPNKDALFEVIIDRLMCRFDDQCAITFDVSRSIVEQLTDITRKQMCYINTEAYQVAARLVMAESIRCPKTSKLLMDKFDAIEESCGLLQWVHEGVNAGRLNVEDTSLAIEQYIGSIKAVVFWPQLLGHLPPASCEQLTAAIESAAISFAARYQID